MIVGTVVGSLLLIFVLLVFLGLLYWKLSNRHCYEKEFSNEIRYCTALQLQYRQQGIVKGVGSLMVR